MTIMILLMGAGADITTQDPVCSFALFLDLMWVSLRNYQEGKTALHYACDRGHMGLIDYLLEDGADIQAKASVRVPLTIDESLTCF
jgi:ankyrin repeat protein